MRGSRGASAPGVLSPFRPNCPTGIAPSAERAASTGHRAHIRLSCTWRAGTRRAGGTRVLCADAGPPHRVRIMYGGCTGRPGALRPAHRPHRGGVARRTDPERHKAVNQAVRADWKLTKRGFGPWAWIYLAAPPPSRPGADDRAASPTRACDPDAERMRCLVGIDMNRAFLLVDLSDVDLARVEAGKEWVELDGDLLPGPFTPGPGLGPARQRPLPGRLVQPPARPRWPAWASVRACGRKTSWRR